MKEYSATGRGHTGTSGFTNYGRGTSAQLVAALDRVFAAHPGAVVLDGDDNWYASQANRPAAFAKIFGIKPLASFHTGISGISKSGIVVSLADAVRIEREFPSKVFTQLRKPDRKGLRLRECVRVYEDPA